MLALLPDNTTGDISPQDIRDVVSSLYVRAPDITSYSGADTAAPATAGDIEYSSTTESISGYSGIPVTIHLTDVVGYIQYWQANAIYWLRYRVSLDGGSTWASSGRISPLWKDEGNNGSATDRRHMAGHGAIVTGTPTGNIVVQLGFEWSSGGTTNGFGGNPCCNIIIYRS